MAAQSLRHYLAGCLFSRNRKFAMRKTRTRTPAKKSWLSTWGSVVGYCALIFILSSQSGLKPPRLLWGSDILAHFLEYAVLGWLWTRAVRSSWPGWTALTVLLSTLTFTSGYGLSDEWHQYYVPGRYTDLRDALMDTLGGICGGISYLLWLRVREKSATD